MSLSICISKTAGLICRILFEDVHKLREVFRLCGRGGFRENLMYYCLKNVSNYLVASLLDKTYFATANKFGFFKDEHAIDASINVRGSFSSTIKCNLW